MAIMKNVLMIPGEEAGFDHHTISREGHGCG
jgi:hypothetical protein